MLSRVVLVVCLALVACASREEAPDDVFGTTVAPSEGEAPPQGDDPPPPAPQPPPADGVGRPAQPPAQGGTAPAGDGPTSSQPAPATSTTARAAVERPPLTLDDAGPLGSMGPALLSPRIPNAVLEVDTTPGLSLTTRARQALGNALRAHGGKQAVTSEGSGSVPASRVYSVDDLRRLTREHRSTRSTPERVAVYVLVLDGRYEAEGVTGVAFAASSFALFPDTIGGGLLTMTSYPRFEEAVAVHELGHLFGLVNLTGHGEFHEDPEHPGHARSRGSVMYWAVEDVSIANLFRGGPPTAFDADDVRELELIRAEA